MGNYCWTDFQAQIGWPPADWDYWQGGGPLNQGNNVLTDPTGIWSLYITVSGPNCTGMCPSSSLSSEAWLPSSSSSSACILDCTYTGQLAFQTVWVTEGSSSSSALALTLNIQGCPPSQWQYVFPTDPTDCCDIDVILTPGAIEPVCNSPFFALSASPNPAVLPYGTDGVVDVNLTATMQCPEATGSVVFYNGNTWLGAATIVDGVATITTEWDTANTYTITAYYQGDQVFSSWQAAYILTVESILPCPPQYVEAYLPWSGGELTCYALINLDGTWSFSVTFPSPYSIEPGTATFTANGTWTSSGFQMLAGEVVAGAFNTPICAWIGSAVVSCSTMYSNGETPQINPDVSEFPINLVFSPFNAYFNVDCNPLTPTVQGVSVTYNMAGYVVLKSGDTTQTLSYGYGSGPTILGTTTSGEVYDSIFDPDFVLLGGSYSTTALPVGADELYGSLTANPSGVFTSNTVRHVVMSPTTIVVTDNGTDTTNPTTITATITPSYATGTITFTINGVNYPVTIVGGQAVLQVPYLGVGGYTVTVCYAGESQVVFCAPSCETHGISIVTAMSSSSSMACCQDVCSWENAAIRVFTVCESSSSSSSSSDSA
jgi:hypothetical protein